MKNLLIAATMGVSLVASAANPPLDCKLDGFVGERIGSCIEGMIMTRNTDELVEPFRHHEETDKWQSEFVGKWLLGALASYRYNHDPKLLEKINNTVDGLIATQSADGYIGNYADDRRLEGWDIWGRKYCTLSLLDHYRQTGSKASLEAARKLIDGLINELDANNIDISSKGFYHGMAACSILEPVVYLYRESGDKKYLDFAKNIAASIEKEGNSQLVTKALNGINVSQRFPFPKEWWSYENGHKAYEMMSCYVGLMELGKETGNPVYLDAAVAVAKNIVENEINIAGSGAAFECWYGGKERQTTPAYHTMETCVTFTWMQFLSKLWEQTHDSAWMDNFERTMYNALIAAMRADGGQISMYSPLEGSRVSGDGQCGMHINCCNANGPRGFALIPEFATKTAGDTIFVNLYVPGTTSVKMGKNNVNLVMTSEFPYTGKNNLTITQPKNNQNYTVALRVPQWANGIYDIKVDGATVGAKADNGYVYISRKWNKENSIDIDFDLKSRVVELNGMQAVTRGPLTFARDSRYGDGYVDECCVIQAGEDGVVETRFAEDPAGFAWLTLEVPAVLGLDLDDAVNGAVKYIKFCDFASAGSDWNPDSRYRVWLVKPIHAMQQPFHKYDK